MKNFHPALTAGLLAIACLWMIGIGFFWLGWKWFEEKYGRKSDNILIDWWVVVFWWYYVIRDYFRRRRLMRDYEQAGELLTAAKDLAQEIEKDRESQGDEEGAATIRSIKHQIARTKLTVVAAKRAEEEED